MHVPEENLERYRELMNAFRRYDRLGNKASNVGHYGEANRLWGIAGQHKAEAQKLRVPGKNEEPENRNTT